MSPSAGPCRKLGLAELREGGQMDLTVTLILARYKGLQQRFASVLYIIII